MKHAELSAAERCPKCGTAVAAGASLCAACDYVLDPSEIVDISDDVVDDVAGEEEVLFDPSEGLAEPPSTGARYGGEALILGKIGDEFEALLSDQTGAFPIGDGMRVVEPAPVYLAQSVQALTAPNAILAVKDGVDLSSLTLNPFESAIAALVDGERPVARIRTKLALSQNDLTIGLAMLADRGLLELKGLAKPADLRALLDDGDLDESREDISLTPDLVDDADDAVPAPLDVPAPAPFDDAPSTLVSPTNNDDDLDDPGGAFELSLNALPDAASGPSPFDEPAPVAPAPVAVASDVAQPAPLVFDLPADALMPLPLPDDALTPLPVPDDAPATPADWQPRAQNRTQPPAQTSDNWSALDRAMLEEADGANFVRPAASTRPLSVTAKPPMRAPAAVVARPSSSPSAVVDAPVQTRSTLQVTSSSAKPAAPIAAAVPTATQAKKYDPAARQKAETFIELALKDLREGKKARAFSYAKMAAGIDPEEPTTKALMADWGKAEEIAKASAEDQKLVAAASEAESKGDFKRAVELLKKALVLRPNEAELHNRLGVLLATRLQDLTAGTSALMRAVELDPKNVAYRSNLGKVFKLSEVKRGS